MPELPASLFSPQTWPFNLEWLPRAAYLVGGNVRDALLGRHAEYLDLDFVLPEGAVKTAKAIAQHYHAGFVLLDAERQIARVVFEHATVDFAQQVGDSLEEDLWRRDFTVNAIAYNPHTDQLIDPLQGYRDLQQKTIRMIASANLKEDPLRLLRAYRQSAQLGFALESKTQSTIHQLASLLQNIAAERVQGELSYLINSAKGTIALTRAWEDGLFAHWLPHATANSLAQVAAIDRAAIALKDSWHELKLTGWTKDQQKGTRSWAKIAKLACLVDPDPQIAESELWHLKYSRSEVQAVLTVMRAAQIPQGSLPTHLNLADLSLREQYFLFRGVGAAFPAWVLVAIAVGIELETIELLIQRFLTLNDPVAHPVPPLTGRDLMTTLKLSPGPQIGQLLEAVQLAQAEGQINSHQQALDFAVNFASDNFASSKV
ncbi:MAG: CCA tRNA nucleotidyltransferase [Timaviella obliquedivisa GSE-PSE-MK23-08B]|nr:CCA tRNA nucleotidyltransferase [Timaviella obliquedivisa GSE-PSE-MK23-08B]